METMVKVESSVTRVSKENCSAQRRFALTWSCGKRIPGLLHVLRRLLLRRVLLRVRLCVRLHLTARTRGRDVAWRGLLVLLLLLRGIALRLLLLLWRVALRLLLLLRRVALLLLLLGTLRIRVVRRGHPLLSINSCEDEKVKGAEV